MRIITINPKRSNIYTVLSGTFWSRADEHRVSLHMSQGRLCLRMANYFSN